MATLSCHFTAADAARRHGALTKLRPVKIMACLSEEHMHKRWFKGTSKRKLPKRVCLTLRYSGETTFRKHVHFISLGASAVQAPKSCRKGTTRPFLKKICCFLMIKLVDIFNRTAQNHSITHVHS